MCSPARDAQAGPRLRSARPGRCPARPRCWTASWPGPAGTWTGPPPEQAAGRALAAPAGFCSSSASPAAGAWLASARRARPDEREQRMVQDRARAAAPPPDRRTAVRCATAAVHAVPRRTGNGATAPGAGRRTGSPARRARSGSRRRSRRPAPARSAGCRTRPRSASMSGSSARLPSGNHFASPVRNVRGISHGPRWRAGHQLQAACLRHGVDRDPGADPAAVDVVVGLVLVPGRALPGAALLDQDVVVVQPHPLRAHQLGRDARHRQNRASSSSAASRSICRSPR